MTDIKGNRQGVRVMTNSFGRSGAIALAIFIFFMTWAIIAARPWIEEPSVATDPRIVALNAREARLRRDATQINAIVKKRWTAYQAQLNVRKKKISSIRLAQRRALAMAKQASARAAARQVYVSQSPASNPATRAPVVRVTPSAPVTQTKTS